RPTRGSTGAAGRPEPRSGDQAGVVADLAHQLLEHVLEGDDADHGAVRVGGGAEVGAGGLHALERLPQRLLGADPGKLAGPGAARVAMPSAVPLASVAAPRGAPEACMLLSASRSGCSEPIRGSSRIRALGIGSSRASAAASSRSLMWT